MIQGSPFFGTPMAQMGYVGFIRVKNPIGEDFILRVTTADFDQSQEIAMEDVIDSRYDKTVYRLQGIESGGNLEFPAIFAPTGGTDAVRALYELCVKRNNDGRLTPVDMDVRYAPHNNRPFAHDFIYKNSLLDTWGFSVSAGEGVSISCDVLSEVREEVGIDSISKFEQSSTETDNSRENVRQVTWNDCRFEILMGSNTGSNVSRIEGRYVTEFNVDITNGLERYYSFNGRLTPQDIAPTKRDVTGSFQVFGRHEALASVSLSNQMRAFEDSAILFGFAPLGGNMGDSFGIRLPNVIFKIEEMGGLKNDAVTSTINFISMPAAGTTTSFGDPLLNTNVILPDVS